MLHPLRELPDPANTVSLAAALADYAARYTVDSDCAIQTARHCLIDALGRGFEALRDPECAPLIGPLVPGAVMPGGARVPGTSLELDPAQAAFCTGLMLCRSASGCHWLSTLGGCVADPLAAILPVADYQARKATMEGKAPLTVRDVLAAIVKAVEIQGLRAREELNEPAMGGTASIRFARAAAAAIATAQLGGTASQIVTALSYACIEGGMTVNFDERAPAGRTSLARADAASRAVRHACQAMAAGSSYLTSADLGAADLAGAALGARPGVPNKPLRTEVIDRLAGTRTAEQVAELTSRFRAAVERYFPDRQAERIKALFAAPERLDDLPVNELLAALVTNGAR
ncbi:MAG TPA: MmgE/PrpD family protein [Steroidobacteraceae bacterium]|nr:MmgE/PrpD family protein [Steroidobacteraceae bacterium]